VMDFLLVALYVACELIANVTAAKPRGSTTGLAAVTLAISSQAT